MQQASLTRGGLQPEDYWSAGTAPILELNGAADPFHIASQRDQLHGLLGDRVTTVVVQDASHAMFPEQPQAVARAVIDRLRALP